MFQRTGRGLPPPGRAGGAPRALARGVGWGGWERRVSALRPRKAASLLILGTPLCFSTALTSMQTDVVIPTLVAGSPAEARVSLPGCVPCCTRDARPRARLQRTLHTCSPSARAPFPGRHCSPRWARPPSGSDCPGGPAGPWALLRPSLSPPPSLPSQRPQDRNAPADEAAWAEGRTEGPRVGGGAKVW